MLRDLFNGAALAWLSAAVVEILKAAPRDIYDLLTIVSIVYLALMVTHRSADCSADRDQ